MREFVSHFEFVMPQIHVLHFPGEKLNDRMDQLARTLGLPIAVITMEDMDKPLIGPGDYMLDWSPGFIWGVRWYKLMKVEGRRAVVVKTWYTQSFCMDDLATNLLQ